jgi:hypothetical protein
MCLTNGDGNIIRNVVGYRDIAMMYAGMPTGMLYEIENSGNVGHVIRTLNRMPDMIKGNDQPREHGQTLSERL